MKCTECNGTGERETNIEGADCPVVCGFCHGTGCEDIEGRKIIITLIDKRDAVSIAIDVIKVERKTYNRTLANLELVLDDINSKIEEIRKR